MSKTLTTIVQDHKSLDQLMIEQGGELTTQEQEAIVDAWMAELQTDLSAKADNYEYRQRSLESASELLRARAKMFSQAAKVLENMSESLKDRMKIAMLELGTKEIVGNAFKFKLANSKPSVVIENEDLLDSKFMSEKIVITPNKDAIKAALDAGEVVAGARLDANVTLRVTANKGVKELQ